jgi:hypothetical protein
MSVGFILIGGMMVICVGLFIWLFYGDEWSDL